MTRKKILWEAFDSCVSKVDVFTGVVVEEKWGGPNYIHRCKGPAIVERHSATGVAIYEAWYHASRPHRIDGPAVVERHSDGTVYQEEWWIHGRRIREPGVPRGIRKWGKERNPPRTIPSAGDHATTASFADTASAMAVHHDILPDMPFRELLRKHGASPQPLDDRGFSATPKVVWPRCQ